MRGAVALKRSFGVGLAAVAVAGATWAPRPALPGPPQPEAGGALRAPEPPVVAVAREALRQGLPERVRHGGRAYPLERLKGGRAIVCHGERACALVARGAGRILVVGGPGARRKLLRAAREGEPR